MQESEWDNDIYNIIREIAFEKSELPDNNAYIAVHVHRAALCGKIDHEKCRDVTRRVNARCALIVVIVRWEWREYVTWRFAFRRIYPSDQDEVYHSDTDGRALPRIGELASASGRRTPIGGKHVRERPRIFVRAFLF